MTDRDSAPRADAALHRERGTLLQQLDEALDGFMVVLSLAWIALLVAELVGDGLPRTLEIVVLVVWGIFVLDFVLEFTVAPAKGQYLRTHWLTVVSLALPALRVIRIFSALRLLRGARVVRSVGLLRVLTSINRGFGSLRATAARRGVGYVLAATAIVMAVGAAGMASFESPASLSAQGLAARPLQDYGDALWWTAYTMTTGATHQPATAEGRLLGWLLSLYGLGIFGYLTATLASHFVGREREAGDAAVEPDRSSPDRSSPDRSSTDR